MPGRYGLLERLDDGEHRHCRVSVTVTSQIVTSRVEARRELNWVFGHYSDEVLRMARARAVDPQQLDDGEWIVEWETNLPD